MQGKQTMWTGETFLYICTVWLILALIGMSSYSIAGNRSSDKLVVYTVNYPLAYFAERIAGGHANVVFPATANEDPAYWMPDAKTISAYQKADLILLNGADYAAWVTKVSLPRFRMVDTSREFTSQLIRTTESVTHSHGPGGKHEHRGYAFTTWIDFTQAALQAKAVMHGLIRKRPERKAIFEKNYRALENELLSLDRDMQNIVSKNRKKPLLASHPVYQYLARRYGLNVQSVHWEPDQTPSHKQWSVLNNIQRSHPARWMIWEGEPGQETTGKLKSMGVDSVVFDPCGNVPERGDFMLVMRVNVENLRGAF